MTLILDAVVVGSGALGCATAFYLMEAGIRRVGVVDRGPLVSGMTRRNAGLVHTHHDIAATTRLSIQSLEVYRHWAAIIGGNCGFVETGTIIYVESEEGAVSLRERIEMHRHLGVDTKPMEGAELAQLFPQVSLEGVVLAGYEPASGYVDPVSSSQGFARRAREKGAKFETGTLVKQVLQQRGQVTEVVTTIGNIQSPVVVVTAGGGAEHLLAPLGVNLNLQSRRGVIGFFEQPPALHEAHPTILNYQSSSFVRPHSFHLSAVGITDRRIRGKAGDGLDESVSNQETAMLAGFARQRLPLLEHSPLKRAHAILYEQMPDGYPVLGAIPGTEGLYVAAGFGEDAVATAPAVGRAIAELVVDGRTGADLSEFRLTRQTITHDVKD